MSRGGAATAPARSAREDAPFRHYTWKHRVTAWVSIRLFDRVTYTIRHGLLRGMRRRGGLGWIPAALMPRTETSEHRFWRNLDLSDKTVYDVGAFEGLLTLLFASRARAVVSYEPNTANRARLKENIALNQLTNVTVRNTGLGSCLQTLRMVFNPLMPGGASVEEKTVAQLEAAEVTLSEEIPVTTLDADRVAHGLPAPDLIKIDTEGWELEVLRGARVTLLSHRPALFMEMHGETVAEKRRKVAELVAYLFELGYTDIIHVETGTVITPANSAYAMEGHLYCSNHHS